MKSNKLYILFLIPFLLFSNSCEEDFLDNELPFSINSETFFNSEEDFDLALIGAYDLLGAVGYITTITAEIASDNVEAGGESASDVVAWQQINLMTHTPVNDQLRNIWTWTYAGINRCNFIFEFQDNIDFEGKTQILAETAFLRAFYYFQLVKFFGGVPMPLDQRVLFGEASNFLRLTAEDNFAQIEADLTFAIENLPNSQSQLGRATQNAALALLGKVHLYQEEFPEAISALETVIASNAFELVEDYSTIFLTSGENGSESVFEIQYTNIEGADFNCIQCSEGNVMVGFSGIRGYSGPVYESGFSFNIPRQELVDAFEEGDLRLEPTILDIDQFAIDNPEVEFIEGFDHTGFFQNKYIPRQGDAGESDVNLTYPNNIRQIRYSDVLLMLAEAFNRGGIDDARALQLVNQVRDRAGLNELSVSGQALTDAIFQERRVELAGEGHRFFDLVRIGEAANEIEGFTPGTNELFPIPSIEIQLVGNIWPQNEGY
ncbi:MAG: RagB/SusD family nutrient uptake outer membrane protein [Bacteroidota bacterium]